MPNQDVTNATQLVLNSIDKGFNKLGDLTAKAADISQNLAHQYGPDALKLGLGTVQVNCGQGVLKGIFSLVFSIVCLSYSVKWGKVVDMRSYDNDGPACGCFIAGASSFCLFIYAGVNLLNIWVWVGLFNPKLYVANEIMQKILQ